MYGTFSSHIKPTGHFTRVYGTKNTLHVDYVMRTVTLDAQSKLPSAIGRLVPAFDQGLQYLREGGKNLARFARSDFHYFSGMNGSSPCSTRASRAAARRPSPTGTSSASPP